MAVWYAVGVGVAQPGVPQACERSGCVGIGSTKPITHHHAIARFGGNLLLEKTGKNLHTFNPNQTHKINTIKDPNILKPQLNPSNYLHSINLIFKTSYFQYHGDLFDLILTLLNSLH